MGDPFVLVENAIDIDCYPTTNNIRISDDDLQITIGDTHGNALKLLYFLIHHGIISLSKERYEEFVKLYYKNAEDLTQTDLSTFDAILNSLKINHGTKFRLMGDEVWDRGANDYYTLKIIELLNKNNVDFEILLSNHGISFIHAYEVGQFSNLIEKQPNLKKSKSMLGLKTLLDKKLITTTEFHRLVEAYKPNLKLISYSLDPSNSEITLYSHAAMQFSTVKALADYFNIAYADDTALELADTIEKINSVYAAMVNENRVHTLYNAQEVKKACDRILVDEKVAPAIMAIWNQSYNELDRSPVHKGYRVKYVHGHDNEKVVPANVWDLNNKLGKKLEHIGEYRVLLSYDHSLKQRAQPFIMKTGGYNKEESCEFTLSKSRGLHISVV